MTTANHRSGAMTLAEVAHELRAPLGGIDAMAKLLSETPLTAEQRRLVDGLRAAAQHLRDVAGDVIDEARGLSTRDAPQASTLFRLRMLLDAVSQSAEARARAKGLSFHITRDRAIPDGLEGDPRRIRQMLENLIDNAFKVTSAGSVSLAVRQVDRRGAFSGIMFEVRDTGPGIAAADHEQLFKHFSRVDNGIPGSGLGLAMVARMARAMGGDAGCSSEPDRGATFWFTLRLRAVGASADAGEARPSVADAELPVLVVDDNHANRMILRAVLEHFGHQVLDAATGEEALSVIAQGQVKAVMLDQTLPGLSGIEVLKAIRATPGPAGALPVVPVTGRVAPEDRKAFADAGADGFVEKPVNASAIRDALDAALEHRGRRGAAA